LRKHFQFNTRVTSTVWDEERQLWTVETDRGERFEAPFCIMATGPLSVPKVPDIPGVDKFKGRLLHAGRWPHEPVSFEGLRVGVIGTGSTGIQIVQDVGPQAGELFVFQRTPSFTMPMRNVPLEPEKYVAEVKRNYAGMREAARNSTVGGTRPQSTRAFFSVTPEQRQSLLEDAWKQGGLAMLGTFADLMVNEEANEHVADFVRGKIAEVVKDPKTAEKHSSPRATRSLRAGPAWIRATTKPTTCPTCTWWTASPTPSSKSPSAACARLRRDRARHADPGHRLRRH
jgi:cation diffusion facilitator CzcD-associated flavoprotein CzcO